MPIFIVDRKVDRAIKRKHYMFFEITVSGE